MMVAQGYQESMLNQSARNRWRGRDHAGQAVDRGGSAHQYSRHNDGGEQHSRRSEAFEFDCDQYFSDPKIDPENRLLLTFAAYNAGPNRIAELRKQAPAQGLDPNKWFGNVELMVAKERGADRLSSTSATSTSTMSPTSWWWSKGNRLQ